jgi:aerobic-type carbon monoxide dehydrogenase small subunit (CoxS/CutS family)
MASVRSNVNGRSHTGDVDPTPLLYVLSDYLRPRGSVQDAEVTTLEGLGSPDQPHPPQQAFIDEQAVQCGFCLSGVILSAKPLLTIVAAAVASAIFALAARA